MSFSLPDVVLTEIHPSSGNHAYDAEYSNIHKQRIALVDQIHKWQSIALPVSMAIFGVFVDQAIENGANTNPVLLCIGLLIAQIMIMFARYYTQEIDTAVVRLYPRIIALELMLDFHFYRNYFMANGGPEKDFVLAAEKLEANTTTELWEKVNGLFNISDFPTTRRGHGTLNKAASALILIYAVITLYMVIFLKFNDPCLDFIVGAIIVFSSVICLGMIWNKSVVKKDFSK